MNAFDFDNTIYDGESIYDFFVFCLIKNKKLLKFFPKVIKKLIEYKLNKISIDKIYDLSSSIINYAVKTSNYKIEELVKLFWKKNIKKLKPEILKLVKKNDLIITGCPDFLINYISDKLNTKNIISTKYNVLESKVEFINLGQNKVLQYKKIYGDKKIDNFYTDSFVDTPFMKYSKNVYFVKKNKITLIK